MIAVTPVPYAGPWLVLLLNSLFMTGIGLAVAVIATLSYLTGGPVPLLFLGAGMLVWGLGGWAAALGFFWNPSAAGIIGALTVTIAGACHCTSALTGIARVSSWFDSHGSRIRWLAVLYLGVSLAVAALTLLSLADVVPLFYLSTGGLMSIRHALLDVSLVEFTLAAVPAWVAYVRLERRFLRWYALGLALIAVGLAAFQLTPVVNDLVDWVGRCTLYLGAIYIFVAVWIASREFGHGRLPVSQGLAAALQEAETLSQPLLEALADAVAVVDEAGSVQYWNKAAERMFGQAQALAFHRDLLALLRPVDQADLARHRLCVSTASQPGTQAGNRFETRLRNARNEAFWAEISCYQWRGVAGTQTFCVIRDISERKRAEESLQRAMEHLEARVEDRTRDLTRANADVERERRLMGAILQQAADGILVVDQQGRVLLANEAVQAYGRLQPGANLAEVAATWGEVLDAPGRPIPAEDWSLSRALRGEPTAGREVRIVPRNGRSCTLLVSTSPLLDDRQAVIGAVLTFTDVTDLKRMETQLRASLADRETLVREVQHRMKNNLAMLSSLLTLQAEAIQDPQGKAALEESQGRVHSLALLHEQLYRSLEQGRIRLDEYLRRLAEAFEQSHGVRVTLALPPDPVLMDADRVIPCGLIVNELLTNALKHAFPRAPIGEIGVGLAVAGDQYEVRVWDRGAGVPPGFRLEDAPSLGLRLVRILARQLGCRIALDTTQGTQLTITFPRQPEAGGGD